MLNKAQRKVLFELMRGPRTKFQLSETTGLSRNYVMLTIGALRKNNVSILTVGSHPNYEYEYGGKRVASQSQ